MFEFLNAKALARAYPFNKLSGLMDLRSSYKCLVAFGCD
jgi:hypothetical protein